MERTVVTRSVKAGMTETIDLSSPALSPKRSLDSTEPAPDSSSSKRVKVASQSFAKHSRFWALDGNVILRFDSVAFKLHRSRLSTQSVWFEKLFEKRAGREEPLEDDETDIDDVVVEDHDGIDVYDLEFLGDMEDFEALLTVMDDAIEFFYAARLTFPLLAAVFRAATTFKFHKFVQFTKQTLLQWYSDDLNRLNRTPVQNPAAAVILGRTWDLPALLKRAFYELLRSQPAEPSNPDDHGLTSVDPLREWKVDDLIRLSHAQKRLAAVGLALLPSSSAANNCSATPPCGANNAGALVLQVLWDFRLDILCGLLALMRVNWAARGYCQPCADKLVASFAAKRAQIWEDLDVWFNIPIKDEETNED
ncbi:hypothetical protein DFH06DRAFT_1065739 [Mycena polygramma]|nr:hypothetical protein DFH06DRAFT_1065739 [Mycena polygramma]